MSYKRIVKALANLGLSEIEAEIYIHLAKEGPQEILGITEALGIRKHQIYNNLRNLQKKGLLKQKSKRSRQFDVKPFQTTIDLLINTRLKNMQSIEQSRQEILSYWQSMMV
jgi:sugar-specific transcriptional regulator TrmB